MLEAAVVTKVQDSLVDKRCQEVVVQVRAMETLAITKMDLMALMEEAVVEAAVVHTAVLEH